MTGVFNSVVDYSWGLIGCLIGVCWGRMNKGVVHHLQLAAVRTMSSVQGGEWKRNVKVHGKSGCSFPVQLLANLLADILTN